MQMRAVTARSKPAMTPKHFNNILPAILFILLAGTAPAQLISDLPEDRPDPAKILRAVQRNFPERPVHVSAELLAKNKRGDVELTRNVDFTLDLAAPTGTASYVISDAFGEELERLIITRPPNEPIQYEHFTPANTQSAPLADPSAPIDGLDFSWADLSMDFLWWTNVTLAGHENKIGRPCHILEVRPDATSSGTYARVQLWVDQNTSALLEAQGYDHQDQLLKKLQIKNLRKVDTLWTVGDIEVHAYPSRSKTRLRVRDIQLDE